MDNYHLSPTAIQYVDSIFYDPGTQQEESSMVAISNVARLAGVSRGTVSNIVNHVKVRPKCQGKVGQAIKGLGYAPNAYVRSLKSDRTYTVALILSTVWFPFFSRLTNDMEQELRRRGYKLLLCNSQNDYHLELEYTSMAKEDKVDGTLSITYSDITPHVTDIDIPMVAVEHYFNTHTPLASTDNFQGDVMAAQKLLELGYRRLAFIGRLSDKSGVTKLCQDGFISYCQENDTPFIKLYLRSDSQEFILGIGRFVEQEFKNNTSWDGVPTAADRYVEYVIDSLCSHSCPAVPGRTLQIIGFDGTKSHANDWIRISSVHRPVEDITAYAVDTLCRQIVGGEVEHYKLFPVTSIQGKAIHI